LEGLKYIGQVGS